MKLPKKYLSLILSTIMMMSVLTGCNNPNKEIQSKKDNETKIVKSSTKKPKYIFTFIGDGMSHVQINAAQVYNGTIKNKDKVDVERFGFTKFPVVGSATTQDATSFAPDSASTATAISSGIKTHSGVIGLNADKITKPESITEKLKKDGYKIGIVSSVSLDHATPAAFYAHTPSRSNYYEISNQMANSDFDYFAGGSLLNPKGKDENEKDIFEVFKEKGYKVTNDKEEINSLDNKSGKVYAINPNLQDASAMTYNLDAKEEYIKLKDFVKKGIDVLDNDNGFFMMVESGKIDWAGHANDAMSNIKDVEALSEAVDVAIEFANKHPEDTLILVTGDHETGGMSIGQATTGYDTAFDILDNQKMSYIEFDNAFDEYKEKTSKDKAKIEDILPLIKDNFGLIKSENKNSDKEKKANLELSEYEYDKLNKAFEESMKDKDERKKDTESVLLYGGYNPISVTLTHILNNKAGIGWTSYAHTGVPVPVYAMGAGAEQFNGHYDNTDIFKKLVTACELK